MKLRTRTFHVFFGLCIGVWVVQAANAQPVAGRLKALPGHTFSAWSKMTPFSVLPATNELRLAIGLPLRDPAGLDRFLAEVYDPASTNFHRYLMADELAARFGPSEADYAAVKEFARTNGFRLADEHPNRLILDVIAKTADVEKAFHVGMRKYRHQNEARDFYAPDGEPTVEVSLPVADVQGLSDYSRPRPRFRRNSANPNASPRSGTAPDGSGDIFGNDFRNAYAAGVTNTGAGQMVGLVQFDGFYTNDIKSYAQAAGGGRTNIPIQVVLLDGFNGVPTTGANSGNGEVSLDIEMAMAMAPGLAKIVVFEAGPNGLQNDVLNSMLTFSNSVKNLSCSWGWDGGPSTTTDNIFKLIAAAGQSFFNASGDTDAFVTGSNNDVDNVNQVNAPSSSPYITQVGGTTLTMSGSGVAFSSETVWNDHTVNANGGNWGSSGGISTFYAIPTWQAGISMASNGGSTTKRNIPDVALTANNVYSTYDGGSAGSTGGTSCAAPLWAGFMALVNQQAAVGGGQPVGFINPAVYALSQTAAYTNCFHDTKTGNNAWSASAGKFVAVAGYDLATGLGTPNGTNLINALAPPANTPPSITSSPASRTNSLGATTTFTVVATGSLPVAYQWYFTNAISDATNASLVLTDIVASNAGSYYAIVTNAFGRATSAVAQLTVSLAPGIAGFTPAFGVTNDTVSVNGLLFTNVTDVSFNGVTANFTVNSLTNLSATVPAGATTGPLSVTTLFGNATTTNNFTLLAGNGTPVIASFTPTNAFVNTAVVITGTNFAGVTGVGFNGRNAAFAVNSFSQITATVPGGTTDGLISVTNAYGVGFSATPFVVATNPVGAVGISQIYGGGGNSGATYENDYIELYNRSGSAVSLSGWSVQYASASGSTWTKVNLSGSVPAAHYFLIQCASDGTTGATLPAADISSTAINLSASKGKIALLSAQTNIPSGTSSPVGIASLVDFVGYGNADAYQGAGAAPTISATTADFRLGGGATDTGNNAADFATGAPNPRNSSSSGIPAPDLAVKLSHSGSFTQGDSNKTYTIVVTNSGSLGTTGLVTVVDTLPAGLTATALGGSGWTANLGALTCTRTDALASAASYPAITVTVSVATNAAANVTNIVTVSGGGDANATNNVANDPTVINPASGGAGSGGIIAGWEVSGINNYGPSPWAPTNIALNVTVVGLARGSGVPTNSSPGNDAWGGTGFVYANQATAIAGNSYVTFSITAAAGYRISLTNIPTYNIRHSGTGSTNGIWQYQVGNSGFVNIGTNIVWGPVTSGSGNTEPAINLSGIAALQNVPPGTNVTFRIVLWGGTSPGNGSWYVNNIAGLDLQVLGVVAPVNPAVVGPAISSQPATTNVFVGGHAGFSVTATGDAPLHYQWFKGSLPVVDGGGVSGSETNGLDFLPAATNHAGGYSVIITNPGGSVTSAAAQLNVAALPMLSVSNAPGGFLLAADNGAISNRIVLERATNLEPPIFWEALQTNLIGADGQIRFPVTNQAGAAGYYRVQAP